MSEPSELEQYVAKAVAEMPAMSPTKKNYFALLFRSPNVGDE